MKRMDRYKSNDTSSRESRLDKNQELYHNVSSNVIYTNITDVTNSNAYEIKHNQSSQHTTREAYQQMKKYKNVEPIPKVRKDLDDFNYLYKQKENKIYDINSVLEEARKNREDNDNKEAKRKLKNQSYNILLNMDKEELEKYREEKRNRVTTPEEDELREVIDTIASKTLAGELDKEITVDLLSDLMATNMLDKVEASSEMADTNENDELKTEIKEFVEEIEAKKEELEKTSERPVNLEDIEEVKEETEEKEEQLSVSKQVLNKDDLEKIKNTDPIEEPDEGIMRDKDEDFYTRSMDLSDKDFEMSDDFKEKKLPVGVVILIVLLILAVLAVAGYFIYKRFM